MIFQVENDSALIHSVVKDSIQTVINDTLESIPETQTVNGDRSPGGRPTGTNFIISRPDASKALISKEPLTDASDTQITTDNSSDSTVSDNSILTVSPFNLYYKGQNKFHFKPELIWSGNTTTHLFKRVEFSEKSSYSSNLDWALILGAFSVFLLLVLKAYYQKYVTKVMNTMINFQLADNLFREKNSIAKRAFFLMNLNFIIVFSLFILMIFRLLSLGYFNHPFKDYLLIISFVSFITLIRFLIFYTTAYIFKWMPAVHAHLHVNYLINKNLGLILLPLVFIAIYSDPFYSKLITISGIILIIIFTVFRLIRGFQIILRNGILLFYAILYLCTLELLPIVLGSRMITLLR